jgi:hypothetical protein
MVPSMKIYGVFTLLITGWLCSGCLLQKHTASMGASGVVLDSQTRSPLRAASVSVLDYSGRGRPITTGDDGVFSIPPVQRRDLVIITADFAPPGRTLVVKREGYDPAFIDLATQQTSHVEVLLSPVTR